jgi:hypothetical protein
MEGGIAKSTLPVARAFEPFSRADRGVGGGLWNVQITPVQMQMMS